MDDELANEPGRGSNDGPGAFESESLDGDFTGAQILFQILNWLPSRVRD